ncbi:hypothetical protein [Yinghuangia seranimata]|uniref:hypothetical protein n=1 Tax=Yinghuangia seranimata TaxID=408067 RepID=UPI00248AFEAE|nr:hypothetical protein [Yinghuangia seranimata]MDI2126805.1 hypothetical protein [Yinghuangia seranimata]
MDRDPLTRPGLITPDDPIWSEPLPGSAAHPDQGRTARSSWRLPVERHDFDPMAMIAGGVFMAIAVMYMLDANGAMDARPGLMLALAVIGVGASGFAGAVWAVVTGRRRKREAAE